MPGHAPSNDQEAEKDIKLLEELIKTHDVVFMLTDSRESRWLPTVLAAAHNKV
jgi:ubiquitin-like modifier-activating enzyme ATG7